MRIHILPIVMLFSIGIMACSTTNTMQNNNLNSGTSLVESEETTSALVDKRVDRTDLSELFWARQDSAKMQFTQPDVDFMAGMIGHHAQALIMSSMASVNNASPSVVTLTKRIINAQKDEIGIMQRWLHDRNQMVPQVTIDGLQLFIEAGSEPSLVFDSAQVAHAVKHFNKHGSYMDNNHYQMMHGSEMNHEGMDHGTMEHGESEMSHEGMDHSGMHDHSSMPGMLTQKQLEELALAKGIEFDRLFLTYMIQHHTGAIIMVKDLVETDGAAQEVQIGKLAGEINVDQKTEIERMRLMLMEVVGLSN
ncbi:MAG: DUF305 domain-containing protein [Bacteroidetes bacterium]|nr:DUF305 domain-containing protein [Bacteroidota bacterium]MDA1125950.1 DUF305 domain-containing protein [Bacteroidota bacterium]